MNYMIYIMSDIHGLYDRYLKMLQKIDLQKEDKLYILGDVIDRGDMGIDILIDLMERDNVELFLGNHEHMMLTFLNGMDRISWFYEANGGMVTYKHFMALNEEKREDILAYLYDTTIVKNLEINGHRYVLSHTGAPLDGKDLYTRDYFYDIMKIQDLVWNHSLQHRSSESERIHGRRKDLHLRSHRYQTASRQRRGLYPGLWKRLYLDQYRLRLRLGERLWLSVLPGDRRQRRNQRYLICELIVFLLKIIM